MRTPGFVVNVLALDRANTGSAFDTGAVTDSSTDCAKLLNLENVGLDL